MREMISDKLKELGTAQENMYIVNGMIDRLDEAQIQVEKCVFDSINTSDKVLSLIKEGKKIVSNIQRFHHRNDINNDYNDVNNNYHNNNDYDNSNNDNNNNYDQDKLDYQLDNTLLSMIDELGIVFQKLSDNFRCSCEISHDMEQMVTNQRRITDDVIEHISLVNNRLNQTVACAELLLTMSMDE